MLLQKTKNENENENVVEALHFGLSHRHNGVDKASEEVEHTKTDFKKLK